MFLRKLVSTHKSTRRYNQKTNIDIFSAVRTSKLLAPRQSYVSVYSQVGRMLHHQLRYLARAVHDGTHFLEAAIY
jgi:hypothetical protein